MESALTCLPTFSTPPHHSPYVAAGPAALQRQKGDTFSTFPVQLQGIGQAALSAAF